MEYYAHLLTYIIIMIMDWVIDYRLKLCQVRITIFAENGVVCTDIHDLTDEIVAGLAHVEFLNYLTFQS